MRTLGLAEDDPQRSAGLRIGGPAQQQLGTTDDHGERIVQLVARPGGEFGKGLQLAVPQPVLSFVEVLPHRRDEALQPLLEEAAIGDLGGPGRPGGEDGGALEPLLEVAGRVVAPEMDLGQGPASRAQRDNERGALHLSVRQGPAVRRNDGPFLRVLVSLLARICLPDHASGRDLGLLAPEEPCASRPALRRLRGCALGNRVQEAVPRGVRAQALRQAQHEPGALPGHCFFLRSGIRRREHRAAAGLDLGNQDPQASLGGHRLLLGRGSQGPGGLLRPAESFLDDREPARFDGHTVEGRTRLTMEPRGFDDQRFTAQALGQPAAEVAQVGAKVLLLHRLPLARLGLLKPARHPPGIDGGNRPPPQPVKQPGSGKPAGVRDRPASRRQGTGRRLTATVCLQRLLDRLADETG